MPSDNPNRVSLYVTSFDLNIEQSLWEDLIVKMLHTLIAPMSVGNDVIQSLTALLAARPRGQQASELNDIARFEHKFPKPNRYKPREKSPTLTLT